MKKLIAKIVTIKMLLEMIQEERSSPENKLSTYSLSAILQWIHYWDATIHAS